MCVSDIGPADTGSGVSCARRRRWGLSAELNILALIKGEERYVYVYDDTSRDALLETFHQQAADLGLSLNWFDAVVLSQKAEEQARSQPNEECARAARF
jgi:hypothetical protein